eukprot:67222_1
MGTCIFSGICALLSCVDVNNFAQCNNNHPDASYDHNAYSCDADFGLQGACCIPGECCQTATEFDCDNATGIYNGDGTQCGPFCSNLTHSPTSEPTAPTSYPTTSEPTAPTTAPTMHPTYYHVSCPDNMDTNPFEEPNPTIWCYNVDLYPETATNIDFRDDANNNSINIYVFNFTAVGGDCTFPTVSFEYEQVGGSVQLYVDDYAIVDSLNVCTDVNSNCGHYVQCLNQNWLNPINVINDAYTLAIFRFDEDTNTVDQCNNYSINAVLTVHCSNITFPPTSMPTLNPTTSLPTMPPTTAAPTAPTTNPTSKPTTDPTLEPTTSNPTTAEPTAEPTTMRDDGGLENVEKNDNLGIIVGSIVSGLIFILIVIVFCFIAIKKNKSSNIDIITAIPMSPINSISDDTQKNWNKSGPAMNVPTGTEIEIPPFIAPVIITKFGSEQDDKGEYSNDSNNDNVDSLNGKKTTFGSNTKEINQETAGNDDFVVGGDDKIEQLTLDANTKSDDIDIVNEINNIETAGNDTMGIMKSNNYKTWSIEDVFQWIMCLDNGAFQQYSNVLLKNLKNENAKGSCLMLLDSNDLHRFGITDIIHKKLLLQKIQKLTSKEGI